MNPLFNVRIAYMKNNRRLIDQVVRPVFSAGNFGEPVFDDMFASFS